MSDPFPYKIHPRVSVPRGAPVRIRTAEDEIWEEANPVLKKGEPGWDGTDFKIGDGTTAWNDLAAVSSGGGGGGGGGVAAVRTVTDTSTVLEDGELVLYNDNGALLLVIGDGVANIADLIVANRAFVSAWYTLLMNQTNIELITELQSRVTALEGGGEPNPNI